MSFFQLIVQFRKQTQPIESHQSKSTATQRSLLQTRKLCPTTLTQCISHETPHSVVGNTYTYSHTTATLAVSATSASHRFDPAENLFCTRSCNVIKAAGTCAASAPVAYRRLGSSHRRRSRYWRRRAAGANSRSADKLLQVSEACSSSILSWPEILLKAPARRVKVNVIMHTARRREPGRPADCFRHLSLLRTSRCRRRLCILQDPLVAWLAVSTTRRPAC